MTERVNDAGPKPLTSEMLDDLYEEITGKVQAGEQLDTRLWQGLPTLPLISTAGLQVDALRDVGSIGGDLRSLAWPGQETGPQQGTKLLRSTSEEGSG